jgi:hypothetical protein
MSISTLRRDRYPLGRSSIERASMPPEDRYLNAQAQAAAVPRACGGADV